MSAPVRLKGVAASIGVAVGPARVVGRERRRLSYRRMADNEVSGELDRFAQAVSKVPRRDRIRQGGAHRAPRVDVCADSRRLPPDARRRAAHRCDLRGDSGKTGSTPNGRCLASRSSSRNHYSTTPRRTFRSAREISTTSASICCGSCTERGRTEHSFDGPTVLVAHDLTPADAVRMLAPPTVGLVTEMGARSSHTAILARTFGVPAVVGVGTLPTEIEDDEVVLVDGFAGEVTLRAPSGERRQAEARRLASPLCWRRSARPAPSRATALRSR